jgi:hypothetical protein
MLGHNSLMPMGMRVPPHYYYYNLLLFLLLLNTTPFTTTITTTTTTTTTNNNNNKIIRNLILTKSFINIVPWWRYLLGYRLSHSISHTLYSRLHRRYYNRSVTTGSLTSCVDYRLLAVGLRFDCWLLSSPAGSLTRLQNCKLKNWTLELKNWLCWCRGPA